MDFLNHSYLNSHSPCDYTFNFWNDYLGLSTLVTSSRSGNNVPPNPNSITESLKATLGLGEPEPCACAVDSSSSSSPSCSPILELKEHFSIFSPFREPASQERAAWAGLEHRARRPVIGRPVTKPEPRVCVFCRNNGAPEEVFGSHVLKAPDGRVVCPILRAYTCPLCSASGDHAHTLKYCPLSKEQPAPRPLKGSRPAGGKRLRTF